MKYKILIVLALVTSSSVRSDNYNPNERFIYGHRMASYMDTSVDPCDDFDEYACGNYFEVNKNKAVHGVFGPFQLMRIDLQHKLHQLLSQPVNASSSNLDSVHKARIFYQSCLRADLFPYKKSDTFLQIVDSIGGWPVLKPDWRSDDFDWVNASCVLKSYGIDVLIREYRSLMEMPIMIGLNSVELTRMSDSLQRPSSKAFHQNRELSKHLMGLYGVPKGKALKTFNDIVIFAKEFEGLQQESKITSEEEDVLNVQQLSELFPEFNWSKYLSIRYKNERLESLNVSVSDKSAIKKIPKLLEGKNAKTAANYFVLKALFELHEELKAPKEIIPFCLKSVTDHLSPIVSSIYLDSRHHEKHIEDEILAMGSYIRVAFKEGVKSVDWMSRELKKASLKYIDALEVVVGDSEYILDKQDVDEFYSKLNLNPVHTFQENLLNVLSFAASSGIFHEEDPSSVYEVEVNAFYIPFFHKLILPPGIFQKPFYYPELPKAYNFGAIGFVLAHEFTHSMDGTQLYREWWPDESMEDFNVKERCFRQQYSKYKIGDLYEFVKGNNTIGDNIADNGGLHFSFNAYKKWLTANRANIDMKKQSLPGLNATDSQLFFLSFAQLWCQSVRGYKAFKNIKDDEHSPGKWRTIGALVNFDEFSKAYNCPLGSRMNPVEKCRLYW